MPGTLTEDGLVERQREMMVEDGAGGYMPISGEGWSPVGTWKCAVLRATRATGFVRASERVSGGRLDAESVWDILFELAAEIEPDYRLTIAGNRYYVIGTDKAVTGATAQVVQAVMIREAA